jgi:O-antigen/teichoic acid export membrane protein
MKENAMDKKKFGYYVFGGAIIGAFLGLNWSGGGNPLVGLGLGALIGTAIGWFAAAYVMEQDKQKKEGK